MVLSSSCSNNTAKIVTLKKTEIKNNNELNEVLKEVLIKKIDRVNQTENWKNRYSTKLFCTRYSNLINIKK